MTECAKENLEDVGARGASAYVSPQDAVEKVGGVATKVDYAGTMLEVTRRRWLKLVPRGGIRPT